MSRTSRNYEHTHTWSKKKNYTSIANGHHHKINIKKRLALPSGRGNHTHKLMGKG